MSKIFPYLLIISSLIYLSDIAQKTDYAPDDTYIYLQYAKNIASGGGFSFNYGEPSYGVTSPLWVMFLTIPYFFNAEGFWYAKILDLLCFILSVYIFIKLGGLFFEKDKKLTYLAASVFMLNAWLIRWSFTGMETSLAVMLLLLSFYFFYDKKYSHLFLTLGFFHLVRPETFVLSFIMFITVLVDLKKNNALKINTLIFCITLYLIPILIFFIYSYFNFGTVLPNTTLGKSTLTLSFKTAITQFIGIIKLLAASSGIEMVLTFFCILFVWKRKYEWRKYFLPLAWIIGFMILYIVTDADLISRYMLLITPLFILTGIKLFEFVSLRSAPFFIMVYVVFAVFSQYIFYFYVKPHADSFSYGVKNCFIPAGNWLNQNTPQSSIVLLNDVGAIGYYANRYIIDAAGLINRDLALNKKIMNTPLEKRTVTHNLLDIVDADYVIDRDTTESGYLNEMNNISLEHKYTGIFPSLGIKDENPKYYKIYKVIVK